MIDKTGNLPLFPGIFPDYSAPIVHNSAEGRELVLVRWGHAIARVRTEGAQFRSRRNQCPQRRSPHWRRWLGVESRCVVPFTSFSENDTLPDGKKSPVWFAFDETRPLAFFAGIWTR